MHCQFVDTAGGSSGSPRQIKYRSLKCPPIVDEGVTTSGSETRNTAYEEEEIHITVLSRNGGGGVWLHGRQTENTPSTRQVAMADDKVAVLADCVLSVLWSGPRRESARRVGGDACRR